MQRTYRGVCPLCNRVIVVLMDGTIGRKHSNYERDGWDKETKGRYKDRDDYGICPSYGMKTTDFWLY